jgi:hypothetical protein
MSFAYKDLWTEAHFTGILEKFRTKRANLPKGGMAKS